MVAQQQMLRNFRAKRAKGKGRRKFKSAKRSLPSLNYSQMARKSADGAIGATKTVLIEHAVRAGRKVALVPPAYTTMTCSGCGARAKSRCIRSDAVGVRHSSGNRQGDPVTGASGTTGGEVVWRLAAVCHRARAPIRTR